MHVIVLLLVCWICNLSHDLIEALEYKRHLVKLNSRLSSLMVRVPSIQWVKKLSQCLAVLERLTCRKPNKLCNNLQIIYIILGYLGFQTSPILCDLD